MDVLVRDSLRTAVEVATGGRNTVLYDDQGNPHVMVIVPKFSYEDLGLDAELGAGVCTAFLVDGVEVPELFIGKYRASRLNAGDLAHHTLPGMNATLGFRTFDNARTTAAACGAGWHVMTVHEHAALLLWSSVNGTVPRGNTDARRAHDATHEVGRDYDLPGGVVRTGSGPDTWRHNHSPDGVADLVGNDGEWLDGFKVVDGRIVCTNDNAWFEAEANWTQQAAYFDSPAPADGSGDLGAPILSEAVNNYAGAQGDGGGGDFNRVDPWHSIATSVGYVSNQTLRRLLIEPATVALDGHLWVRNYGTRRLARGGQFGVYASRVLSTDLASDAANTSRGLRLAYMG